MITVAGACTLGAVEPARQTAGAESARVAARALPASRRRTRLADHPRRLRAGGSRVARDVSFRRAVHLGLRPRPVAVADQRPARPRIGAQPDPRRKEALPEAPTVDERGIQAVRPVRLRPDSLEQPCLREERPHAARKAPRLLLPHADALCLGGGIPRRRGSRAPDAAGIAAAALPSAPPGPRGSLGSRCVRRQLPSRRRSHRALLRPTGGGRPPAGRCRALPRRGAPARGLLPGLRPRGSL